VGDEDRCHDRVHFTGKRSIRLMKPIDKALMAVLICILGAALCMPVCAVPQQNPGGGRGGNGNGIGEQIPFAPVAFEVRLARIALFAAVVDAKMEGTITYIGQIDGDNGTGDLTGLRGEFNTTAAGMVNDTTKAEFRADQAELLQIRKEFRNETRDLMDQYDGNRSELQAEVRDSLAAHNDTLSDLRGNGSGAREIAMLAVYDRRTEAGNDRLDALGDRGLNISEPRKTLDEIEGQRPLIESAFDTGNRGEIKAGLGEIRDLSKEFRQEVREVVKEQAPKGKSGE
jgi:hypothetical protein